MGHVPPLDRMSLLRPSRNAVDLSKSGDFMSGFRFWIIIVLLLGTGLLLHFRGRSEAVVSTQPLSQLPSAVAGWTGADQQIDPDSLQILGRGEYLARTYTHDGVRPSLGLFIVYYRSQKAGTAIHSPKHCLPGAGWSFESSKYIDVKDFNGKMHR